ncbi:MAG: hypothetical protein OXI01_23080 [Albidovulum sp.]|nr:hypothetical protein [Albidovulum sp.]
MASIPGDGIFAGLMTGTGQAGHSSPFLHAEALQATALPFSLLARWSQIADCLEAITGAYRWQTLHEAEFYDGAGQTG